MAKTIIEQALEKAYKYDEDNCVRSSRRLFAENMVKEALRLFAERLIDDVADIKNIKLPISMIIDNRLKREGIK